MKNKRVFQSKDCTLELYQNGRTEHESQANVFRGMVHNTSSLANILRYMLSTI